jgi:hypothetical protein
MLFLPIGIGLRCPRLRLVLAAEIRHAASRVSTGVNSTVLIGFSRIIAACGVV